MRVKKIDIILGSIAALLLIWALAERTGRVKLLKQLDKTESEYYTALKDNSYLNDKIESLEEKIKNISIEKEELAGSNKTKEEYIDKLEIQYKKAKDTIEQLQDKIDKIDESLNGSDYQVDSDIQN
jgi:peptidoglycan hydrolase CwlO-like protein